jgi:hypothetical protein
MEGNELNTQEKLGQMMKSAASEVPFVSSDLSKTSLMVS